mgnify:CR=1 FL=1
MPSKRSQAAPTRHGQPARPLTGWFVGPIFLALALWFGIGPQGLALPASTPTSVDRSVLTTAPRRTALSDPPTVRIDGFDRTCMSCHRMFPPREVPASKLLQHRHIALAHGINDRCHNCHHDDDRDLLVLRDESTISFGRVVELCAQCHGPTYRDWQRGAHGRTNGYWDAHYGEVRRLGCTECHDPHQPRVPAMDPLAPLPGPQALRAPAYDVHDDHIFITRDPLRRQALRGHVETIAPSPAANSAPVEVFDEEEE